jgi:hypothetical protein
VEPENGDMTGIGRIDIHCPAMGVSKVNGSTQITDNLPSPGVLTLPDGTKKTFSITFPPTLIDKITWIHWRVRQCPTMDGNFGAMGKVMLVLPPEDCLFTVWPFPPHVVAKAIKALGTVWLDDGSMGKAEVVFPDVPSYWQGPGHWKVDPVDAFGPVVF